MIIIIILKATRIWRTSEATRTGPPFFRLTTCLAQKCETSPPIGLLRLIFTFDRASPLKNSPLFAVFYIESNLLKIDQDWKPPYWSFVKDDSDKAEANVVKLIPKGNKPVALIF